VISTHPNSLVSDDGRLMNEESHVNLELLPLRCHVDQGALRFIRTFFLSNDDNSGSDNSSRDNKNENGNREEIGNFFQSVKVRPCKIKVKYHPIDMDLEALREGSFVEVLNFFDLEGAELTMQPVLMSGITGWGSLFSELCSQWIGDICATQLHKFIAGASPLSPLANVGGAAGDFFLIPVKQYVSEGKITKGVRRGTSAFVGTVVLEALNASEKITQNVAKALNYRDHLYPSAGAFSSRPPGQEPENVFESANHCYESIARGLKVANYSIVVKPSLEYQQNGTTGAIKCVVRAIPVAFLAPLCGASEALSYTLHGIRNQLRPDIRKEEEEWLRCLE